jgi:pimeloyl-ACP methyl ester carboxylesterase/predicted glycosyltransferase
MMPVRSPDVEGFVERDGVKVGYELYDNNAPTILLFPTWSIVHARAWKGQLAYLARHWRVVLFDPRGNGRSDRPTDPAAYADEEFVRDAIDVLDATGSEAAVLVGWSRGGKWAAYTAALHPDRALGAVLLAPGIPFTRHPYITAARFTGVHEPAEGWDKFSLAHWRADWADFVRFFHEQVFPEPHSSKQREDATGWSLETDPETIALTMAPRMEGAADPEALLARVRCPVLVVHAEGDRVNPYEWGVRAAELTGGHLLTVAGESHGLPPREPVFVNRVLHDFATRVTRREREQGQQPRSRWVRGLDRRPRVLYLSSPIGLGHIRRDLAIARQLATQIDGLAIDWLTQPPVTGVLEAAGHQVHPASRWLASESAHLTDESGEHDLHVFEAFRRMDELMVANFHVFQEVVEDGRYDLVVADEAWDVDLFWHHNPELKRAPLAWLTDFVGYLPAPDGDGADAWLTADYNAEMLSLVERFHRVRDRALFVGEHEDVVDEPFGPGLPRIRDWTTQHFDFTGYITGFDASAFSDVEAIRAALGYHQDERICVVSVGGSGIGHELLRRAIDAYPAAAARIPGLRMVVVAGPRIDPRSLPAVDGVEVRGYVPALHRHLAVCDVAVVQGGLTTTMELTAAGRPFVYLPLKRHFEQRIHVHHRLQRHGAGRMMEYDTATPERLAEAMAQAVDSSTSYAPVPDDGAARAATALAELL